MDYYYRKPMGNGAVASKFKLSGNLNKDKEGTSGSSEEIVSHSEPGAERALEDDRSESVTSDIQAFNCDRCYRLKKKCLRNTPRCRNCERSGAECKYIDRRHKKTKRDDEQEKDEKSSDSSTNMSVFRAMNDTSHASGGVIKQVPSESLSPSEIADNAALSSSRSRRENKRPPLKSLKVSTRKEITSLLNKDEISVANILTQNSMKQRTSNNLKDAFINIPAMGYDHPRHFLESYFQNYGTKYPFIEKDGYLQKFQSLKFDSESIINLDMYVLLSIGCLIFDNNNGTELFSSYFNDNRVQSVVENLNYIEMNNEEENFENLKLFLLVAVYALSLFNEKLCWGVLEVMDRLVNRMRFYIPITSDIVTQERIFWSIFNLDIELSLLANRPSMITPPEYVKLPFEIKKQGSDKESIDIIIQEIALHKLQHEILHWKLKGGAEKEVLKRISADLEKWRVKTSRAIHEACIHDTGLQNCTSIVNLNYYYLLIELDQVSSSESLQFTLQFLSNSFSLFIAKEDASSKPQDRVSICNLVWYVKFFNVIKFTLLSLKRTLIQLHEQCKAEESQESSLASLKLSDFNSNLQLILNLCRFIIQNNYRANPFFARISGCSNDLSSLCLILLSSDFLSKSPNQQATTIKEVELSESRILEYITVI